jgi:UDP-N-acetylmuramate dehydrogenase
MAWRSALPPVRGKLLFDEPLAPFTWFRVGGPAEALFLPADEDDLAGFLAGLAPRIPVTVLGVGSNLIVRDGGVEGVAIRLAGRAFAGLTVEPASDTILAGAGALDAGLSRFAAESGLAGVEFYAGIPGAVGGALSMNAGCYGSETADVLVEARGLNRNGERLTMTTGELGYTYRASRAPGGIVWVSALFRGRPDQPAAIKARMAEITGRRETTQPIREKTGGSTFKNPPGQSAWRLVDEAGWRGRGRGGAIMSPLHANFMINTGEASAADLESLGEKVRADVLTKSGVELEWEIRRIGRAAGPESR